MPIPTIDQDPWGEDLNAELVSLNNKANTALANAATAQTAAGNAQALATTANTAAQAASDAAADASNEAAAVATVANAAQADADAAVATANAAAVTAGGAQEAADDAAAAAATATAAADAATAAAAAAASVKAWARDPDQLIVGEITRDSNGAVTAAAVEWPDETPGAFTALVLSSEFPGAVDSYRVTYGNPVTKTYTQPTMTRDATGAVVVLPEIVVT